MLIPVSRLRFSNGGLAIGLGWPVMMTLRQSPTSAVTRVMKFASNGSRENIFRKLLHHSALDASYTRVTRSRR
jgi:hypothetical protein